MLIFPAIDLLGGKAVRLYQGDYNQKTEYGQPLEFARKFEEQGARNLHLVDLDAAKTGQVTNYDIVAGICRETRLFVELGGGIRDEETIKKYLDAGVDRLILGTAALKDPSFTQKMVDRYGEHIAVGVDARDGKVAVEGWLETSNTDSYEFCRTMMNCGVKYIIYTDISRDGAQIGPNLDAYKKLASLQQLNIIASGGVTTFEDLQQLRAMGTYGAIIGKALYSGAIELPEALKCEE